MLAWRFTWPTLFVAAGIAMVFGPMFASGLALHPYDPTDPRFTEYLLEHSYRWLTGELQGGAFDLPMGYPLPGMLAHAEPMLSYGPAFWPFRLLGFSSSSSHQLWLVSAAGLNFASFYLLARRATDFDRLAASASAFIFAFGLSRVAQIGHSQLWFQLYFVGAILGLHAFLAESSSTTVRRAGIATVAVCIALQLWGSIYLGIFLFYVCALTGLFALIHPAWRPRLLRALSEAGVVGIACGALALACLWPLLAAYLSTSGEAGSWSPTLASALQPRLGSLIYTWQFSWFYGWMYSSTSLAQLPALSEQDLGLGLVTSAVTVAAAVAGRRRPIVLLCCFIALVMLVPVIVWPGGFSLWPWVRSLLPGLGELRAVGRIGLLLLVPASIAVGAAMQRRHDSRFGRFWLAAALLCVVEQGASVPHYAKARYEAGVQRLIDHIDPAAETFFYVAVGRTPDFLAQVDAILAAQKSGTPTINMYTGRYPESWKPLQANVMNSPFDRRRIRRHLDQWIRAHGLDPDRVQWIDQRELDGARSTVVPLAPD